ncbi:MAG: hypothetical protein AAF614_15770 [Chloroflexota bacterium]
MNNKSNGLQPNAGLRFGSQTKPQTNFRLSVDTALRAGYWVEFVGRGEMVSYPDYETAEEACNAEYGFGAFSPYYYGGNYGVCL